MTPWDGLDLVSRPCAGMYPEISPRAIYYEKSVTTDLIYFPVSLALGEPELPRIGLSLG